MRAMDRTVIATAATVSAAVLLLATPAAAHVQVEADTARQGAKDVTLTFDAAAESSRAGIISLRVSVPAGIGPTDVALVSAPAGWTLQTVAGGYEVGGPAAAVGEDVRYAVQVASLPTGKALLAFPTVQRYEDGQVDEWTTVTDHATAGHARQAGVQHPAPTLAVSAANGEPVPDEAPPAGSAGGAATGDGAAAHGDAHPGTVSAAAEPDLVAVAQTDDGLPVGLIGVSIAILVVAAALVWLLLRRRPTDPRSRRSAGSLTGG